jgi:hypothetical protein
MMNHRVLSSLLGRSARRGIALVSVLYFLVVCALTTTAVLFAERSSGRNALASANGARLIATADEIVYSTLASWDGATRIRQPIGSTASLPSASSGGVRRQVYVARLTRHTFIIVGDVRNGADGAARRVSLLVRMPGGDERVPAALISAVDVTLGAAARIVVDSASCGDTMSAAAVLAPSVILTVDPASPPDARPVVLRDSAAADSANYLQIENASWNDLVAGADIQLPHGSRIVPRPAINENSCTRGDANWGDPTSLTSACANRVPVIFAAGDLTIDGGLGQGVLLVDGHLTIDGPFVFSGQIVARNGIETLADNITISGVVRAWRASSDSEITRTRTPSVLLTHQTTLRYSRCDAWHGMASSLQPRHASDHAWIELF